MAKKKPFKLIIEECFEILKSYLIADESQKDEAWADFFGCELYNRFNEKSRWEVGDFLKRFCEITDPLEISAENDAYVNNIVFVNLRKKYSKSVSLIKVSKISQELYFNLRRVDEILRKEKNIPNPPKPLVRIYHLRKCTLKVINSSSPRFKQAINSNISSFIERLRNVNNPASKLIFDNFSDELKKLIVNLNKDIQELTIDNKVLSQICTELNRLITEFDGDGKRSHQKPFMFFDEFEDFVSQEEKIKYTKPLTNRYKNRELLSRVFPEISLLEVNRISDIGENNAINEIPFSESKIRAIENLLNYFISLSTVSESVKSFLNKVLICVDSHSPVEPKRYLFELFLNFSKKHTNENVKNCIFPICNNNDDIFRRYKSNLRKQWKRVVEGSGKNLYEQILAG